MQLRNMLQLKMGWAVPSGPNNEVVLSSRVRLARNLRAHPFPLRAPPKALALVLNSTLEAAHKAKVLAKAAFIRLEEIEELDRLLLVERHLISNLLARSPKNRGLVVGDREVLSLMVNEEDHLRIQGIDSGLNLKRLADEVLSLDDDLARSLDFAFHREWGYLASCPTNTGTGLRASCLVHLVGLGLTQQINRVLDGLSRLGVVARGLYGEGTKVIGDFYQISNATSLGTSEAEIADTVTKVVGSLIRKEQEARAALASEEQKVHLEDLVYRSTGALASARAISYEETMQHLSYVRMGLGLGWKLPADLNAVNELLVMTQPGHIQTLANRELKPLDRDFLRANLLRKKFK